MNRKTARERSLAVGGAALIDRQVKRWQAEFPYHWDADELVSRRQLLQFAVYTSGALFASTVAIGVLGLFRNFRRTDVQPIARAGDVPEGQAHYFAYPNPEEQAMLLHLPGGRFVAYQVRDRVAILGREVFGPPAVQLELRNVPPMRVYRWDKPAA